eukprot:Sdes_comp16370_c0_seq2m5725
MVQSIGKTGKSMDPKETMSFISRAACSNTGVKLLQWPHQGAKNFKNHRPELVKLPKFSLFKMEMLVWSEAVHSIDRTDTKNKQKITKQNLILYQYVSVDDEKNYQEI